MTADETSTLARLVEQDTDFGVTATEKLIDQALADPAYADEAFDIIVQTLSQILEDDGNVELITDHVGKLLNAYPELGTNATDLLIGMATATETTMEGTANDSLRDIPDDVTVLASANPKDKRELWAQYRREGIWCLGCLVAHGTVDPDLVVPILADRLDDRSLDVRTNTLWALTRVGMADPAALAPVRDKIADYLTVCPTKSTTQQRHKADAIAQRRYAAEALVLNARDRLAQGSLDTAPQLDSADIETTAAWAIQYAVDVSGFPCEDADALSHTIDMDVESQLLPGLADQLDSLIRESTDPAVAAAATTAIGCITADRPNLKPQLAILNEILDNPNQFAESVVAAARQVVTGGPLQLDESAHLTQPGTTEIELTVADFDQKERMGNGIGIQYDLSEQLFDRRYEIEPPVVVSGDSSAMASVQVLNHDAGEVKLGTDLQRRLAVSSGETVTLRRARRINARKAILELPDSAPFTESDVRSEFVDGGLSKYARAGELFYLDIIPLEAAVDQTRLFDGLGGIDVFDDGIGSSVDDNYRLLPVRVQSMAPKDANTITQNTILECQNTDDKKLSQCWEKEAAVINDDDVPLFQGQKVRVVAQVRDEIQEGANETVQKMKELHQQGERDRLDHLLYDYTRKLTER